MGTQGTSPYSHLGAQEDSKKSRKPSKKSGGLTHATSRVFRVDQDLYVFEDNQYV